jgi:hypothetical protein
VLRDASGCLLRAWTRYILTGCCATYMRPSNTVVHPWPSTFSTSAERLSGPDVFLVFCTVRCSRSHFRLLAMPSIHEEHNLVTMSRSDSSSLRHAMRGEASELLPLDALHRTSLEHEQDAASGVHHVENEVETHSPVSHIPSKPNSVREAKIAQAASSHRAARWKCVGVIIGFLFAG